MCSNTSVDRKIYFDHNIRTMARFPIDKLVYVDRPSLDILPIYNNADIYSKLITWANGPFETLQVTEHTLTVDKNGMLKTLSFDRETPLRKSTYHPRSFKATKTSPEYQPALHMGGTDKETGTSSSRHKDSYTEKQHTSILLTDCYTGTRFTFARGIDSCIE